MKHSLPLSTLVHQMAKNVRITKGNHNASYLLFAVNISVWEKKKQQIGKRNSLPNFFRRERRGRLYYTGYSPFLQDFLDFDTGIKNSTPEKLFFNIFVISKIVQSGISNRDKEIKTNYNFILIIETFSTAIKIHLNCLLVR